MRSQLVAALAAGVVVAALAKEGRVPVAELTAAQVVERNVAARGGLEAWRKVQTMVWVGHMESIHAPVPSMLFVMQQKRPNKTRFEINALGEKTVRVFDGERGWKLKPNREGGPEVKPFSFQEANFARAAQVIDGPLIDAATKGNTVTLEGLDEIDGRKAYRLGVRLLTGENDRVWVDAQTFLDIRYDRAFGGAGRSTVTVFYRDYKTIEGLQIPSVIETGAGEGVKPDKMVIERVMPNAPVDDRVFARPGGRDRGAGMAMGGASQRPMRRPAPVEPSATPAAPAAPDPAPEPK